MDYIKKYRLIKSVHIRITQSKNLVYTGERIILGEDNVKLYYSKGACSMTVHTILRELNIPCEFEEVNLGTKQTASGKNYLEINPKGAVPALAIDSKEILTENVAILQYLADTNNAATLLPPIGHFIRYHVLEWLSFLSSDVHKSFSPIFNSTVKQEDKDAIFFHY